MGSRVTLDDIARAAGVSKYAVSRAISGKNGVSDATRERVLRLCDELGYIRHREKIDQTIIMFTPKSEIDTAAFWMSVIQGIETEAARQKYCLNIKTVDGEIDDIELHSIISNAAGAIFVSHKTARLAQRVYQECPTLLLTYPLTPLLPVDSMTISDREAMEALSDKLIAWGHRHLAYYGPTERLFGKELISGLQRSTEKMGVDPPEIWNDLEKENVYQNTLEWLTYRKSQNGFPSAILCASDTLAQAVIFALNELSVRVPQEVSVTSFNSDTAMVPSIPVTSMGFDKFSYGAEAFRILHRRIVNPERPACRIHFLQRFIVGSTAGAVSCNK